MADRRHTTHGVNHENNPRPIGTDDHNAQNLGTLLRERAGQRKHLRDLNDHEESLNERVFHLVEDLREKLSPQDETAERPRPEWLGLADLRESLYQPIFLASPDHFCHAPFLSPQIGQVRSWGNDYSAILLDLYSTYNRPFVPPPVAPVVDWSAPRSQCEPSLLKRVACSDPLLPWEPGVFAYAAEPETPLLRQLLERPVRFASREADLGHLALELFEALSALDEVKRDITRVKGCVAAYDRLVRLRIRADGQHSYPSRLILVQRAFFILHTFHPPATGSAVPAPMFGGCAMAA